MNEESQTPEQEYAEERFGNSRCVAEAIDGLASILSTYVTQARDGDNGNSLYTSPNGYPVKVHIEDTSDIGVSLILEGETVSSIAESLKRIADAMSRNGPPILGNVGG